MKITDRSKLGRPIQVNGAFYSIKKNRVVSIIYLYYCSISNKNVFFLFCFFFFFSGNSDQNTNQLFADKQKSHLIYWTLKVVRKFKLCRRTKPNISLESSQPGEWGMSVWMLFVSPALKYWPLNLDLGACLTAYYSARKRETDIGPTVIRVLDLSYHMGTVKKTRKYLSNLDLSWLKLIFNHLTTTYFKTDWKKMCLHPVFTTSNSWKKVIPENYN